MWFHRLLSTPRKAMMRSALGVLTLCALLIGAPPAHACPVCIDLPERTTADHILSDSLLVLVRQDPSNPFAFAIDTVLRGHPLDLADAPAIPFLVDSALRRKIAHDPELRVLMSYGPAREMEGRIPGAQDWYRHIELTADRRAVLDDILQEGEMWDWGMTRDPERFGFFAAHHANPDPVIQNMALSELSRAPYSMIREVDLALPTAELRHRLSDISEIPYWPLLILFLGISDDPDAKSFIRERYIWALNTGPATTGAWLVAGIEADGDAALARIAERLADPVTRQQSEDMLTALSVAGTANPALRDAITPLLAQAVERDPTLAAPAAYTVYDWQAWSVIPVFEALLDKPASLDHATRYILEIAVAHAQMADGPSAAPAGSN